MIELLILIGIGVALGQKESPPKEESSSEDEDTGGKLDLSRFRAGLMSDEILGRTTPYLLQPSTSDIAHLLERYNKTNFRAEQFSTYTIKTSDEILDFEERITRDVRLVGRRSRLW